MALNKQNLKVPTSEEAREYGRRGGLASAESRKMRKTLREQLLALLDTERETREGEMKTMRELISLSLIKKAVQGDVRAFSVIRDTIGEIPAQKHELTGANGEKLFSSMSDEELEEEIKKMQGLLNDE